jgi:hypothetical protein
VFDILRVLLFSVDSCNKNMLFVKSLVFIAYVMQTLVFHGICSQLSGSFGTSILESGMFCHVLSLFSRLCNVYVGIFV